MKCDKNAISEIAGGKERPAEGGKTGALVQKRGKGNRAKNKRLSKSSERAVGEEAHGAPAE